jgi:hypothetical protein
LSTPLHQAGANSGKQERYAPLYFNRFFAGLYLQRSPLRDPSQVVYEKYYGGRPDALIAGQNVELTNKLTLVRRPGCTQYSSATFSEAVNSFYAFKQVQNNAEAITLMVDSPSAVWTLTPGAKTSLFTKGSQSNPFGSWMFSVGNSLYISFNNSTDQPKAWEGGSNAIRNWGITTSASGGSTAKTAGTGTQGTATPGNPSSQGPNNCGTGTNSAVGGGPWVNPNNVAISGLSTTSSMVPGQSSDNLFVTNFGFNIPAGTTINGIVVSYDRVANNIAAVVDNGIFLLKAGGQTGTDHSAAGWGTTRNTATYGSGSDLWGASWLYTDINANNFGVSIQAVNNDATHTRSATVFAFVKITVYYTTASISWSNPTNIVGAQAHGAPDYATVTPQSGLNSPSLFATNYGFSLSNNIVGVSVAVYGHVSSSAGSPYLILQLRDQNGNAIGSSKTVNFTNTGDAAVTLGSSTDLWGTSGITTTTANGSSFGAIIIASGTSPTFSLNACTITIYTSAAPGVGGNGSGSLTGTWTYAYSYANTNATTATGNPVASNIVGGSASATLSNNLNTSISVTASSDPQVNAIFLWRTLKGGATLFYVGSYPNSTGTIYDSANNSSGTAAVTDANLDTTKTAATAFQLTPPPQNLYGHTWFSNRLWAFVGNTLYYASGPDLGNIYGNGNEGWPPANYFTFTSQITRLVQVTSGLLVFTVSDVWLIVGNASAIGVAQSAPSTTGLILFNPIPVVFDYGLLSPFALDVNGGTIYLMTSDGQAMALDPSTGQTEIGFPIGYPNIAYPNDPSLASFNPKNTYVAWHVSGSTEKAVYISDGSTGWFRCNPNLPPDGGFVWSNKANIVGGCMAVQSIETAPGTHSLLIGPGASGGPVLVRNQNVFTDNGSTYPSNFTVGAINLAEFGQVAEVRFVAAKFNRVGKSPQISILPDELNGTFENISGYVHSDPPTLYGATGSPATLYSNRYDLAQSITNSPNVTPGPLVCTEMQILVDFSATDSAQNEMLSLGLYGTIWQEP